MGWVHAAEAFYESLKRIPDSIVPKCTAHQAIELLLRQLQNEPVAPQANDEAVDMLGWLELAMDDSPVLIVTGFNEGYVPESVTSDVFLPNSLRSRLGLKDNQRRYARDAYALMRDRGWRDADDAWSRLSTEIYPDSDSVIWKNVQEQQKLTSANTPGRRFR